MKLPTRVSLLFFIGIFAAGSTALGYYYYFVYSPPLKAADQFMDAMEARNDAALRSIVIVSDDIETGRDEENLREPTDRGHSETSFRHVPARPDSRPAEARGQDAAISTISFIVNRMGEFSPWL